MSDPQPHPWATSSPGRQVPQPIAPEDASASVIAERTPQLVWPSRDEEAGALEAFAPEAHTPVALAVSTSSTPQPAGLIAPPDADAEPAGPTDPVAPMRESARRSRGGAGSPVPVQAQEALSSSKGDGRPSRGLRLLLVGLALLAVAQGVFIAMRLLGQGAAGGTAMDGEIVVDSRPSGADVLINGRPSGQTPLRVRVWPGYHVVELRAGDVVRRQHVGVAAGQIASQYVELGTPGTTPRAAAAPKEGTLVITSKPGGAQVTIGGEARGTTPLTLEDLPAGGHSVRLVRGDLRETREVEIRAGGTTELAVAFTPSPPKPPATGQVRIASDIPVTVFEGDDMIGSSDGKTLELRPGRHVLTLVNETLGFRNEQAIEVPAGRNVTVAVTVPEGRLRVNATPWAEVLVDGRSLGETPIGQATLPLGQYELVFRHPKLGERRVPVTIRADRPAVATVDFSK
ncbi:MAG: PEGA domain-containing protein [Luteitalea sp.]|nr:PEGA domain-containing protein [Luteitalea sp.]